MSFSQPEVASLINDAFIPVVLSMHLRGPAADDYGRNFVLGQSASGKFELVPPDLFVVSPDEEVLGRLRFSASAVETLDLLNDVLAKRADLGPPGGLASLAGPAPTDAAEIALLDIEHRYNATTPEPEHHQRALQPIAEGKASLVPELEAWITDHADRLPSSAALARVLLGGARFHAGDAIGAREAWESVVRLHPDHPLRHRALYNLIEPESCPCFQHPELATAPRPSAVKLGIIVPDAAVRARNLEIVRHDPRYVCVRSGMPFVRVPAGTFTMGGSPAVQGRELPIRRVTISKPFLVSAWPVTRELWSLYEPNTYPGVEREGLAGALPAVQISWDEANAFCAWFSRVDGQRYRLPTEAEWEYASRGGLDGCQYPWGDEEADHTRCNYANPRPVPVACYPANGYGLFDCVGNNSEWVLDFYLGDAYVRTPPAVTDPTGPTEAETLAASADSRNVSRVVRGGGWTGNEMMKINCRNSWRICYPQRWKAGNIGFRIVADLE